MADDKRSTFLVTNVDEKAAVLRDVTDGQVHTLADPPQLETDEILEATLRPEPPMAVTWQLVDVDRRWTIPLEESPERPTRQERDIAADQAVGEVTRRDRAGEGELHVISVPPGETAGAVADVLDDEATLARAARLSVSRVEVRAAEGMVSVRYMP
ncbi:MAG: hypothetical protein BRD23_06220 [Halobacteriales archaeon SW_9_67_25]|nr:MAG: hypothetical protein BRD23_06220 [Halobacteriales archaeon SW_9_67_25]